MSTPIAAAGPAVEKSASPKGAADSNHGDDAGNPFGAMLGVALATPSPSPSSTKAPEPKLLELVLDGQWMLDQPTEGTDAGTAASTAAAGATSRTAPAALIPRGLIASAAATKPGEVAK